MERHERDEVPSAQEMPVGCSQDCLAEVSRCDGEGVSSRDEKDVVDQPSGGDLVLKIIKQVEYYFSDENLPSDKYMISLIKANKEGYVPISVISSFKKMKKLTKNLFDIVAALKESSFLVVSADEKNVKRLHPFPLKDFKTPQLCTVVVENLPEDHSIENIRKICSGVGRIKKIWVRDPHAKKGKNTDAPISNKLHALVEYETFEAAEKAAATLNDQGDWRNGLRVKLLKRTLPGKHGNKKQNRREISHEKNTGAGGTESKHKPMELSDDPLYQEGQEQTSSEKNGQQDKSRGQTHRKNKHGSGIGMGHGSTPPGPKMPDGTRGFTMGRGRTTPVTLS